MGLVLMGRLEPWIALILVGVASCFNAIEFPAFSAATTMLVPKKQLGRAGGMTRLGWGIAHVLAPASAAFLLESVGLGAVLVVDVTTFCVALVFLFGVRIPEPQQKREELSFGRILGEFAEGCRYLRDRSLLLWLLALFSAVNFFFGIVHVLFTPLILGFSDTQGLGWVMSLASIGILCGSGLMVAWGGPTRKVWGVLGFGAIQAGVMFLAAWQPNLVLVGTGAFLVMFSMPVITACSQVIWQRKVAPSMQGRVFGLRVAVSGGAAPLAYLVAGPLADHVFQPLMDHNGALSNSLLGLLIQTGPGRGIALMYILAGVALLGLIGYAVSRERFRQLESLLPDFDEITDTQ